jgi:hypothetical protein
MRTLLGGLSLVLCLRAVAATLDTSFSPGEGANNQAQRIVVQGDGRILVIGSFNYFGGKPAYGIVRLYGDGSPDEAFRSTFSLEGSFRDITCTPEGSFVLVGGFSYTNRFYRLVVEPAD